MRKRGVVIARHCYQRRMRATRNYSAPAFVFCYQGVNGEPANYFQSSGLRSDSNNPRNRLKMSSSACLQSYFMILGSFIAFAHVALSSVVVLLTPGPFANSLQQFRFRFCMAKFIFSATTQLPNFKATCHGALSVRD